MYAYILRYTRTESQVGSRVLPGSSPFRDLTRKRLDGRKPVRFPTNRTNERSQCVDPILRVGHGETLEDENFGVGDDRELFRVAPILIDVRHGRERMEAEELVLVHRRFLVSEIVEIRVGADGRVA